MTNNARPFAKSDDDGSSQSATGARRHIKRRGLRRPKAATHRGIGGVVLRRRRLLAGGRTSPEVSGAGVDGDHEGPGWQCSARSRCRRVDHDPLEAVQVHAERIGQDRLDRVHVGTATQTASAPCSARSGHPSADGADARRPSRSSTPTGNGRPRLLLHRAPELVLAQLPQRLAGPLLRALHQATVRPRSGTRPVAATGPVRSAGQVGAAR